MLLTATHPVHCEGNGGAGADHQAGVPRLESPPAFPCDNALREITAR